MNLHLIQARANRLANHRLLGAVAQLSDAEFHAVRTSFFPSLALTLNHLLNVDQYYIAALDGGRRHAQHLGQLRAGQDGGRTGGTAGCK